VATRIGQQLGSYKVTALLGKGGMGEVYRARDSKLNRDVAIKVLPESVTHDPDSLARFRQEAQSIAALNHPNIVTIYSVEESAGAVFFTMELIERKPLGDIIGKGRLPLARLLQLAIPLADAVSAAHQKGITHRDLKPANVMVGADSRNLRNTRRRLVSCFRYGQACQVPSHWYLCVRQRREFGTASRGADIF
jgi:serine/threonine-protein kinase